MVPPRGACRGLYTWRSLQVIEAPEVVRRVLQDNASLHLIALGSELLEQYHALGGQASKQAVHTQTCGHGERWV